MKPGTIKSRPSEGLQVYREPDGTTITLTRTDADQWTAEVKWKAYKATAKPFPDPASALGWARAERTTMTKSVLVSDVFLPS